MRHIVCVAALAVTACSSIGTPDRAEVRTLTPTSATSMTAVVDTRVPELPSVRVVDAHGRLMMDVEIRFTFSPPSEELTRVTVRSGSDGIARLPSWPVPRVAGRTTVSAAVSGLMPVQFDLVVVPGPIASMAKVGGDNQIGFTRDAVGVAPSVRVTDAFENPISGAQVTFAIDSGGGSLSSSTSLTDENGVASAPLWTLGSVGRNALSARVPGLAPVTFTAVAVESQRRCGFERQLMPGVTVQTQLTPPDCVDADGRFFQYFTFPPATGDFTVTLRSAEFDTRLQLTGVDGTPIAETDTTGVSPRISVIDFIVDGRPMTVIASSAKPGGLGAFAISSDRRTVRAECYAMFATKGISEERMVGSTTCVTSLARPVDRFRIFLRASETVTVVMEDRTYSSWAAEAFDGAGKLIAQSRHTANYVETLTFTATVAGYYSFNVTCDDDNGQYKLTIR